MTDRDDLQLDRFWDALALGQSTGATPDGGELLRTLHTLHSPHPPGSARERARQRLIDSTHPNEEHHMSASTIPIGFPSSNGHTPAIARPKPAIPISTRHRPRWVFAALAATLVLLLGSLGAFVVSQRDTRGPSIPAVVQAPQATASPWSQYRNGPGHTGTTTDLGPETNPGTLWTVQTGDSINSEAAIVDGIAYIGSGDGYLYALDAATGVEQWTFATGAAVDCGPAVEHGIVYVTTRNDELIAIATADGSEQWRVPTINSNASAVLDGANLYIPRTDGTIAALDPATGQERWSFDTGLTTARTPAVADGIVVAGTEEGTLFALDAADGSQKWSFVSDGGLVSTTVIADGVVYQAIRDGDGNGLYALDLQTGKERWRYHALDNAGVGIPTVDGDTVYFTADDGRLYALDTSNGVERWLVTRTAPWQADGKVAGNLFYIYHSLEGKLFAFDKRSGAVQWEVAGVDFANKGPSISGGVLYASTPDGLVVAVAADAPGVLGTPTNASATPVAATNGFDQSQIKVLWTVDADGTNPLARPGGMAIAPDGNIYIAEGMTDTILVYSPDGKLIEQWGETGTGPGQFLLHDPHGDGWVTSLAFDADGNLYVFDTYNVRVQKFAPDHTFLLEWGSEGKGNGEFGLFITGTVDAQAGLVYVADWGNDRIQVFDLDGNYVDKWGGSGLKPGQFRGPLAVAVDADGDVYVGEEDGHRLQKFDATGLFIDASAPTGSLGGPFNVPASMAFDATGNLYVSDFGFGKIEIIDPDGGVIDTIDNVPGLGPLTEPTGIVFDSDGNLIVGQEKDQRIVKLALPPLD